jgi:hypothetical protein
VIIKELKRVVPVGNPRRVNDVSFEIGASVADIIRVAEDLFGPFDVIRTDAETKIVRICE